jgi:hypothetical protein
MNSAAGLSPVNFRRENARLVSCYALFKWWLLLSQHPSCLSIFTSFNPLSLHLGTLFDGLGSFPLDYEAYPSQSGFRDNRRGIRSLIGVGNLVWSLAHSVLYPRERSCHDASPKAISGRTRYLRV